jgi:dihydrofolate synthase / folylpolyglutamate synthase
VPADDLASLAGRATHVEADPRRAVALAKELAGEEGVVLATGSLYLIADLLRPPGRRGAAF